MRLGYILLVVAASFSASCEAFSNGVDVPPELLSGNARPTHTNQYETRFLRSQKTPVVDTAENEEERGAITINYAGAIREAKETRQWLEYWRNKKETVASVAAKLGIFPVWETASFKHENWEALAKYIKMTTDTSKVQKYAKFGTGYQSERVTKTLLFRWALEGKPKERVAKILRVFGKTEAQLMTHRNYDAFKTFLQYEKDVANRRAEHFAKLAAKATRV